MLLLQAAVVDSLLKHALAHLASVLQIRSFNIGVRAPAAYRPVCTNMPNQPQPSLIHAELQCDQAWRQLDVSHVRRVGAEQSAWEAAITGELFSG